MAKTSNLRDFQKDIVLRLKQATSKSKEDSISTSRLGVNAGVKKLLINLKEISEVLAVPSIESVPLTQPWFLGVANIRGNLYNIADLAQLMGLSPTPKSSNNRVVLIHSELILQAAILVDSLVGLRSLDAMQVKPKLGHKIAFLSEHSFQDDENEWFGLDIAALVQDKTFTQPALPIVKL